MASKSLSENCTVVRHLSAKDFDVDDDGQTTIFPHAFELKKDEEYLSSSWFEFFDGPFDDRIAATAAFLSKGRTVKAAHAFALGNVADLKSACNEYGLKIRILHEPDESNVAYVAIRRYKSENNELLALLARNSWSRWCDIKIALGRYGPWRAT